MQTLHNIGQIADAALNADINRFSGSQVGWADAEKAHTREELADCILNGSERWDENLTGYRLDMLVTIETVLYSRLDRAEKMAEIDDVMNKYVNLYCRDEVERDPDTYCSRFCED